MPTTFEVSTDNVQWFGTQVPQEALKIPTRTPLKLYFRVRIDGTETLLKLVVPVYDKDAESSTKITVDKALTDRETWEEVMVQPQELCVLKATKTLGVLEIRANDGKNLPAEFTIAFSSTKLYDQAPAKSACKLMSFKNRTETQVGEVIVSTYRIQKSPSIRSFKADYFVLPDGAICPKLSWDIENLDPNDADGPEVVLKDSSGTEFKKWDGEGKEILFKAQETYQIPEVPPSDDIVYTLKVGSGVSRDIRLRRYAASEFRSLQGKLDVNGRRLLGLYPFEELLYALVFDPSKNNVFLWSSHEGSEWEQVSYGSYFVALNPDPNVNDAPHIPLEVGGSPGVVFNRTLYLIGGSRFDTNFLGNEVYFYEFDYPDKGFQKAISPAGFTPRMGHAVVASSDKIYVIGGMDDLGALNEVWSYKPAAPWTEEKAMKLTKGRRCMMPAAVHGDHLYLFGGFGDLPGKADVALGSAFLVYNLKTPNGWQVASASTNAAKLVANGLLYLPRLPHRSTQSDYFFRIYGYLDTNATAQYSTLKSICGPNSAVTEIKNSKVEDIFFQEDAFYSIQSVTYKHVAWICATSLNATGEIQSSPLWYFVNAGN